MHRNQSRENRNIGRHSSFWSAPATHISIFNLTNIVNSLNGSWRYWSLKSFSRRPQRVTSRRHVVSSRLNKATKAGWSIGTPLVTVTTYTGRYRFSWMGSFLSSFIYWLTDWRSNLITIVNSCTYVFALSGGITDTQWRSEALNWEDVKNITLIFFSNQNFNYFLKMSL